MPWGGERKFLGARCDQRVELHLLTDSDSLSATGSRERYFYCGFHWHWQTEEGLEKPPSTNSVPEKKQILERGQMWNVTDTTLDSLCKKDGCCYIFSPSTTSTSPSFVCFFFERGKKRKWGNGWKKKFLKHFPIGKRLVEKSTQENNKRLTRWGKKANDWLEENKNETHEFSCSRVQSGRKQRGGSLSLLQEKFKLLFIPHNTRNKEKTITLW